MTNSPKPSYPGDRDAFKMLQRLVAKGVLVNFNDADAAKLTEHGLAVIAGDQLLPTVAGRETANRYRRKYR